MRHVANAGAGHSSVMDLHSLGVKGLLDALLESATVLMISLFTVVMIVAIVTSVNSHIAPADLWSRWMASPAVDMSEPAPTADEMALWVETAQQTSAATLVETSEVQDVAVDSIR